MAQLVGLIVSEDDEADQELRNAAAKVSQTLKRKPKPQPKK